MDTEANLQVWNQGYDWTQRGDEWSAAWGGPEAQWFHTLYPRVRSYLPASTILEIAPGFGRWTRYLKERCSRMILVDLAAVCIDACRKRFSDHRHIDYYVNDGRTLDMIPDGSVDFAFSFDSLVHVESDIIEAYLAQLACKLTRNGIGFIHHSNMGIYRSSLASGKLRNKHVRAESMTAALFATFCKSTRLDCIRQELINWGQDDERELIDCISLFTPSGSQWSQRQIVLENPRFMLEAQIAKAITEMYCTRRTSNVTQSNSTRPSEKTAATGTGGTASY
jgi:SAM-dependent methyltransferase